mmetsp:Transcript_33917/g.74254  ORF Transcript_33917/g.74254 Transcript_33917/m.74254 type:complete len:263 (+) Transcript_33917:436-1224(+)
MASPRLALAAPGPAPAPASAPASLMPVASPRLTRGTPALEASFAPLPSPLRERKAPRCASGGSERGPEPFGAMLSPSRSLIRSRRLIVATASSEGNEAVLPASAARDRGILSSSAERLMGAGLAGAKDGAGASTISKLGRTVSASDCEQSGAASASGSNEERGSSGSSGTGVQAGISGEFICRSSSSFASEEALACGGDSPRACWPDGEPAVSKEELAAQSAASLHHLGSPGEARRGGSREASFKTEASGKSTACPVMLGST